VSEQPEATLHQVDGEGDNFYNFQIKGWTNFDPLGKKLGDIAKGVEAGDGFLTPIVVLKAEIHVADIGDEDAKECFENMRAAKRVLPGHDSSLRITNSEATGDTIPPLECSNANRSKR
jgi:hypothetical protein